MPPVRGISQIYPVINDCKHGKYWSFEADYYNAFCQINEWEHCYRMRCLQVCGSWLLARLWLFIFQKSRFQVVVLSKSQSLSSSVKKQCARIRWSMANDSIMSIFVVNRSPGNFRRITRSPNLFVIMQRRFCHLKYEEPDSETEQERCLGETGQLDNRLDGGVKCGQEWYLM